MELCRNIHQIRIDFQVTETVSRYVFIYLITGKNCYLIDTGTAGSEHQIAAYMTAIGRSIREIKAILLTHSHPDHMGGAAAVQRASGCNIYASCREQTWIENIDIQFRVRPVPNFYKLLKEPAAVDIRLRMESRYALNPA
ncbi:MBL fold metallo-hydrolase [Lachnospiraceae bacterium OF09-33XD]|nr:MBL fold metallo-hydrolase [Lachnospiraceae bacterium OF09-33XD]